MNKRIYLTILILILVTSIFAIIGITAGRYKSNAEVTSVVNYARPIFNVELMNAKEFADDSSGYVGNEYHLTEREFSAIPGTPRLNVYYKVSNYNEEKVNEIAMDYYLRLIKDDYSDDLPYKVKKVVLCDIDGEELEEVDFEEDENDGISIGPRFLPINEANDFIYKIVMEWPKEDNDISHVGEQYGFHLEAEAVQHP